MEQYEHLKLPLFQGNIERQTRGGGGGFKMPQGRNKAQFSQQASQKADDLSKAFSASKKRLSGKIDPTLIFEIEINESNKSISSDGFEKDLLRMGIHVLSVAEGKKGFWVVFSDDEDLSQFKKKLETYGSEEGPKYDFFNAIESFGAIPVKKKIGKQLSEQPLTDTADFIDIELWKIYDYQNQKNRQFIQQLKYVYDDFSQFRITDTLITKSFVLLRVKLTKTVFDEIIQLKEIARADRPAMVQFNPFEMMRPDVDGIEFNAPEENATGILVIDSGIVSNHLMLEKCVGGEENFQSGETETQDTVGHGTGVAGCAVYGNIEDRLKDKKFTPSNWLFSAKVMYAERDLDGNVVGAIYDEGKLIEHQFNDAVESFLSNPEYHIKVVNISLGNSDEIWHKHYSRQLPLAALIDELAFTFPHVVFVISAGNQSPLDIYNSIAAIIENYPSYLIENNDFKIINPASSALALSVGSIAGEVKGCNGAEQIKVPIAQADQPSPFTRTGFGINGMIKPELVEYGGNLILSEIHGRIIEDIGGKLALLNNRVTDNIIRFDTGTSFAAPKVARLAGKIANSFPEKSANFIKNMLLVGAVCPFEPDDHFYGSIPDKIGIKKYENEILEKIDSEDVIVSNAYQKSERHYVLKSDVTETARKDISAIFKEIKFKSGLGLKDHLPVCGYGLSSYERALYSFDNRAVLWDEGQIRLNQIKVYSLELPEVFFNEAGKKKITVALTFTPETRATRGDSYLGNHMEFHLFHSINPQTLIEKYGVISTDVEQSGVPDELMKYEIDFSPGANIRKAGCHQKAWKLYQRKPKNRPESPVSLVLLNFNKWITDDSREQHYCVSVTFEHEKEIDLYNTIRTNIQTRTRVR